MNLTRSALALFTVLALTALAPSANATLELRISDGVNPLVAILDQGGNDSCLADVNKLCFLGSVGDWDLTVTTGSSKNKSAPFLLDLHGASSTTGTPTTLTVMLSDDGYGPAIQGLNFNIGGTLSAGGTLVAKGYGATSNAKFDLTNQIGSTMTFTPPPVAFSGGTSGAVAGITPYAITIVTELSFAGGAVGNVTYNAEIDPVPEPSSVALLGGILLVTAGAVRRKLSKS